MTLLWTGLAQAIELSPAAGASSGSAQPHDEDETHGHLVRQAGTEGKGWRKVARANLLKRLETVSLTGVVVGIAAG